MCVRARASIACACACGCDPYSIQSKARMRRTTYTWLRRVSAATTRPARGCHATPRDAARLGHVVERRSSSQMDLANSWSKPARVQNGVFGSHTGPRGHACTGTRARRSASGRGAAPCPFPCEEHAHTRKHTRANTHAHASRDCALILCREVCEFGAPRLGSPRYISAMPRSVPGSRPHLRNRAGLLLLALVIYFRPKRGSSTVRNTDGWMPCFTCGRTHEMRRLHTKSLIPKHLFAVRCASFHSHRAACLSMTIVV